MMEKERNSNFELLRTISIILIVLHHAVFHTTILETEVTVNRIIAQIYNYGAYVGVNSFFMITGWFLVDKQFKVERLVKIYGQTWFYSISIWIIFIILGNKNSIGMEAVLYSIFPITFSSWWFVTTYIGLILLSPFINKIIYSFEYVTWRNLIIVLVILLFGIHTLSTQRPYYSELLIAVFYYILSAGIKKHDLLLNRLLFLTKLKFVFISSATVILSTIILTVGEIFVPALHKGINFFTGIDTLTIMFAVISLFCYIAKKSEYHNKLFNYIGKRTFSVYLIQSNFLVASVLWQFVDELKLETNKYFFILMPAMVIAICAICIAIDEIRLFIFKIIKNTIHLNKGSALIVNLYTRINQIMNQ